MKNCCPTDDDSSEYSNFPNNKNRTKQGKFHLLINIKACIPFATQPQKFLLREYTDTATVIADSFIIHYSEFIVCHSLTSGYNTFARNCTIESLTQFPHLGLQSKSNGEETVRPKKKKRGKKQHMEELPWQCLRHHASMPPHVAVGPGLNPGWGTKIPHAHQCRKKKI